MVKCGVCRKTVAAALAVRCSHCMTSLHRGCANLPETGTITSGWLCFSCENKSTLKGSLSIDLGQEIRCFRDELSALRSEVRAYRDEIAEFKSTLNTCKIAIDVMDVRLASLENKSDDSGTQDAIVELETQINERHQDVLANDVEISGLPESIGENIHQLVKLVSKKLGVNINEDEIVHAERVGSIPQQVDAVSAKSPRPRHIAVSFTRRITRENLLKAARTHRGLSSADMKITGPECYIFINERLTPHNKLIYYLARKHGTEHKWKYVWTKNGKILARKASGEQAERIRCIEDLTKVFSPRTN